MGTKTYKVNLKALKEIAETDLAIDVGYKGEVRSFRRHLRNDLRDAIIITNEKHQMQDFYSDYGSMTEIPNRIVAAPDLNTCEQLFRLCKQLKKIDISELNTKKVTNFRYMFMSCTNLEEIEGINHLNTANVTDMCSMFSSVRALKHLDLSNWDTSNVTNMNSMFSTANKLEYLDISGWDTSKVTSFNSMFQYCKSLKEIKGAIDLTSAEQGQVEMFTTSSRPSDDFVLRVKNAPTWLKASDMGLKDNQLEILSYRS